MRFRIQKSFLTAITLFLVAGVAVSDQSTFSRGLIQSSCAPWDGPAIQLTITREPAECERVTGPYISIGVWKGLPVHAGQVVKFGAGSDAGFASRCSKVGDCQRAESGTIVFEKYDEDSGARGNYELHFKGGETVKENFDVVWCKTRAVCG